jgi:hypothetical protein
LTDEALLFIMGMGYSRKRFMVKRRKKTKPFMNGHHQAIKIRCEFQLQTWQSLIDSLTKFTDDFMEEGRRQPPIQKRTRFVAIR